ncbi:enoyl-CoA hydratase/isomerase family protein [Aquihabitans sp. McL0605]|uniref:enoyl-CoA hydratase/isomerase family protein n=1 Tax=Aquihabitans sp. McL0605 TaxID=3415671 RepID=UPI003CF015D4
MTDPSPPHFTTLAVSLRGGLGRLTLDQPDRLNPLGSVALQELVDAAAWFDASPASVVVVTGAGRAFSAGFDRDELAAPSPQSRHTPELGAAMSAAIGSMGAVTLAAVQGPCVGGAFVLVMSCDLRLAADDAWFSLPEAELGIPLAWSGVPLLVRSIGPARTTELVLSCRRVAADEAAAWGLVNRVVPRHDLAAATEELVGTLLERRPDVIATTKRQVREAAEALVPSDGRWAGTEHLQAALRARSAEG